MTDRTSPRLSFLPSVFVAALAAASWLLVTVRPVTAEEPAAEAPAPAAADPTAEELEPLSNEDCATCHDSQNLRKKSSNESLMVTQKELSVSVHASVQCVACHTGVTILPHPDGAPIPAARCDGCHDETAEQYGISVHASGGVRADKEKVSCSACHGPPHRILRSDNPESPAFRGRVPMTCGGCHGDLKMVVQTLDRSLRPLDAYLNSVHGKAVAKGSENAAVCTDCHKSHDILPASDPRSTLSHFKVPAMCGTCHGEVQAVYAESVHGVAAQKGISRAPVCTDCHGIHSIKSRIDPSSSVANEAIARTTCPQCHQSEALAQDLRLPVARLDTYLDSYHGLAMQRGSKLVANCASCHGIHNIFASTDPRSTIHPDRLTATCGTCHPGASENFTKGKIHDFDRATTGFGAAVNDFVRRAYLLLIGATIAGMLVHNLLDLFRKADIRHRVLPAGHLHHQRLDLNQRIQHAILASSFVLLVLTGFALRFPESWLSAIFGRSDETRRFLHRAAAVVMCTLGVYHAVYLLAMEGGRRALREMIPNLADMRFAAGMIAFNLGLRSDRPEPAHFSYVEKAEYWAVVWGTAVMGVTGFLLWFKIFATTSLGLPLWAIDLAHTIHYYEAWLATLAIIVWHFYAIIFDPVVYPMNWAWLTGWVRGHPPAGAAASGPRDKGHA